MGAVRAQSSYVVNRMPSAGGGQPEYHFCKHAIICHKSTRARARAHVHVHVSPTADKYSIKCVLGTRACVRSLIYYARARAHKYIHIARQSDSRVRVCVFAMTTEGLCYLICLEIYTTEQRKRRSGQCDKGRTYKVNSF